MAGRVPPRAVDLLLLLLIDELPLPWAAGLAGGGEGDDLGEYSVPDFRS
jgi:hypothetical protein